MKSLNDYGDIPWWYWSMGVDLHTTAVYRKRKNRKGTLALTLLLGSIL